MLIEFSVENFRSFREMQTLHLQAAPIKSKNPKLDETNIIHIPGETSLLKSKVIYGANASGKSNLVKAMTAFFKIFRHSLPDENVLKSWIVPYLLDTESFRKPTFFQIQFRLNGRNYRYGFEATESEIISEWLFSSGSKGPESYFFKRDKNAIEANTRTFKEGARLLVGKGELPPLYRRNALFLPLVAVFNGPVAVNISRYFFETYAIYSGIEDSVARKIALESFSNDAKRKKMTEVLKHSDLGIEDLVPEEVPEEALTDLQKEQYRKLNVEGKKPFIVTTRRKIKNHGGEVIEVPFSLEDESYGTQKMFWLSPFLVDVLEKGGVLIVDEFGSSLHVRLIHAIMKLFHSPVTNPHNAQIVVATHDTHLLDQRMFRRDQFAFVEKTRHGCSTLVDLVEFKGVRNDASLEREYLQGKFGATPLTNQFDWAFNPEGDDEKY